MSDFSTTEESDENEYSQLKDNIQEIINLTKQEEEKSENSPKGSRKKNVKTRSADLYKQFLELKEFQKNLADRFTSNDKDNLKTCIKLKKHEETSSDENESKSESSNSSSSCSIQNASGEKKGKRDRNSQSDHNDSSLSDENKSSDIGSSGSCRLDGDMTKHQLPRRNSKQSISSKALSDECPETSINRTKGTTKKELHIFKNLCRRILKKEKKSNCNGSYAPNEPSHMKDVGQTNATIKRDSRSSCSSSEESSKDMVKKSNVMEEGKNINCSEKYSSWSTEKYTSNEKEKIPKIKTQESKKKKNEETVENKLIYNLPNSNTFEPSDLDKKTDAEILKTNTTEDTQQKVHVEIMPKETNEKKLNDDHIVNIQTEEKRITTAFVKDISEEQSETRDASLSNKSSDELIRQTVTEIEELLENPQVERSTPSIISEEGEDLGCIGDRNQNLSNVPLQSRIDQLQEQIQSLKKQLEEAKQYNQQEARDILYISSLLRERNQPIVRNGLEWEDWELKELVQERLRKKREAAAQDYRARLRVVDALCSAELGKLEESLQTLMPLNAAASTWGPLATTQDTRSSWMSQDCFFEVITSMNLSSSEEKSEKT